MAQFTSQKSDDLKFRSIWMKLDGDLVQTVATDGTSMLIARQELTHRLKRGSYSIDPEPFRKKPSLQESNGVQPISAEHHPKPIPFDLMKVDTMAKEVGRSNLDPVRMSKVAKAISNLGTRVELFTGKKVTRFNVVNPHTYGEVVAYLANLSIHGQ